MAFVRHDFRTRGSFHLTRTPVGIVDGLRRRNTMTTHLEHVAEVNSAVASCMPPFDLIVIGSGPAGQRAAVQAAKIGKSVAIIEKATSLGGVCTNTGTIPSKTLREAVIDLSGVRQRTLYGGSAVGNTEVTAERLLSRTRDVMARERQVIDMQLRRNHVKVVTGVAHFTGPNEIEVVNVGGSERLRASVTVIAVGTVPAVPRGLPVDHRSVLTSDDILTLPQLPGSLLIVGAGVIGVEYATMFAALGIEVTVTDRRSEFLEMIDSEILETFASQIRGQGVTLRLGEEVDRVERAGSQRVVVMKSGTRIVADMILVSSGRQGATGALKLEAAGLDADERGKIAVNGFYQTAVPHIYAVGDVIGAPQLASTSAEQGRLAACHAFGLSATSFSHLYPFGIYAIPEIAWVGQTERELTSKGIPFGTGTARYDEIARGQILGDGAGHLKLLYHLESRQILGVWILGTQATEIVHIGQAVMAFGGTLDYFINNVFNYPTLAECYKVAALDGYNKLSRLGRDREASNLLVRKESTT
jgi:NAD(P) transhydrogenase